MARSAPIIVVVALAALAAGAGVALLEVTSDHQDAK